MYFGDEHAHLNLLAVRAAYQRSGVGRHLVEWLEESALAAGIGAIRLELRASNRGARRFYERLGFAEIGRVPEYYGGVETAVRMARDIRRGTRRAGSRLAAAPAGLSRRGDRRPGPRPPAHPRVSSRTFRRGRSSSGRRSATRSGWSG